MTHLCHAHECTTPVRPAIFMCRAHWYALPRRLRDAIWAEYRIGQEETKTPTLRYLAVQQAAIGELAFKPHDEEAARVAAPYLLRSVIYRRKAMEAGEGDPLPWIALPEFEDEIVEDPTP